MKKLFNDGSYKWKFHSLGGVVRVCINSGDDIEHLGELDQKLWTVLSCPTANLHFDQATLSYLDSDSDGRIRVPDVKSAAAWLCTALKDSNLLLKGESGILPADFNRESELGASLHETAVSVLKAMGKDENQKVTIQDCVAQETIAEDAARLVSLRDYLEWISACGDAEKVFGDNTADAFTACEAVKEKVEDFFLRCNLISYDSTVESAVDFHIESLGSIERRCLSDNIEELVSAPIARPNAEGRLYFNAVNPAWRQAVQNLAAAIGEVAREGYLTESSWRSLLARFEPYRIWMAARKGDNPDGLGLEEIKERLAAPHRVSVPDAEAVAELDKFLHLYEHFYKFLCNFVVFTDFYALDPNVKAVFQEGRLFIDQRCCELCIKVEDMAAHSDMASLSGMFLIYCLCSSRKKAETMNIVAVMTSGGVRDLRPGKNAVFYDRDGGDWDATVIKIVDNPISISQAFWSPYRKAWNYCVGLVHKGVADREARSIAELQEKAGAQLGNLTSGTSDPAAQAAKTQPFDIAKFAGIFAALGMAIGYIGAFFTSLASGIESSPWYVILGFIVGLMFIISAPSCLIAGVKLHRRNLGPVLNANGWAINSVLLVNIFFGATLTKTAEYPKIAINDPFARKKTFPWKAVLLLLLICAIAAYMYFSGKIPHFAE